MIEERETRLRECKCRYAPRDGGRHREGDGDDAQQPSPEHGFSLHSSSRSDLDPANKTLLHSINTLLAKSKHEPFPLLCELASRNSLTK